MYLTEEQLRAYDEDGYLFLPAGFSTREVERLTGELPKLSAAGPASHVVEKNGEAMRSVYGAHRTNDVFNRLTRHPLLVEPARQMLGGEVYIYQFKINFKAAFTGDVWQWHQDFIFWQKEDGLEQASVTNAAVFLDEVNEFNGPLFLIPGSHRQGCIEQAAREWFDAAAADGPPAGGDSAPPAGGDSAWMANLTAELKYALDPRQVAGLVARHGIVAPKGPAGSVLFFNSNIVHASPNNISPFRRAMAFITFNRTDNAPVARPAARPEFLCSRDYLPVAALSKEALAF